MIKSLLNIVLLLRVVSSLGQSVESPFGEAPVQPVKPVYLSVGGSWLAQSNEINLAFVKKVLYGGTLDRTVNQNIWSNLKQNNQLMSHQQYGIQIRSAMDSTALMPNGFFCIQWQQASWSHLSFRKDVFGLAMLGNASFTGRELDLSGTSFTQLSYQKIGLGFQHADKGWTVFLNYIDGRDFYALKINKGDFYTDPAGQFVDMRYRLTQLNAPQKNSGVGLGMDFQWAKKSGQVQWNLQVADLGWVKFRDVEKSVWKGDERFTGLSWSESIIDGTSGDELLSDWTDAKVTQKNRNVMLPTRLNAGVQAGFIGYRVITYCYERQLGWQSIYFSKSDIPIKLGSLHYEMALNHTFQNRHALSGELGITNSKKDFSMSLMASELPGFLMSNSRQVMFRINVQKRIF
jgi:hypothetical protein